MKKELEIKWEEANGTVKEGKIILRTLFGGEAAEIEGKSKVRLGNTFVTDDKKIRFLRLSKSIVDAPFKPYGKEWKETTDNEKFDFLSNFIEEDVIAFLLLTQAKMGHMTPDTENLLNLR